MYCDARSCADPIGRITRFARPAGAFCTGSNTKRHRVDKPKCCKNVRYSTVYTVYVLRGSIYSLCICVRTISIRGGSTGCAKFKGQGSVREYVFYIFFQI